MENALVSIIVPIYNMASYLDKCIESIVKQTYTHIEILLVNDGSSDTSPMICEKWENGDHRIKYFSKQNEGLGPTRNFGVRQATGKYVVFVDADDWVESRFVEEMYRAAVENDADMVECDFYRIAMDSGLKTVNVNNSCMGKLFTRNDRFLMGNVSQCKILFRRDFLLQNNIQQPPYLNEDIGAYALEVVLANKIAGVEEPLYNYCKYRSGAISTKKEIARDFLKSIQFLLDEFITRNIFEQNRDILYRYLLRWASRTLVPRLSNVSENEYKMMVTGYEVFFKNNFSEYVDSRVFLLGSYNLTKILQKTHVLENPYYRFQFSSIPAIVRKQTILRPTHRNPYRQYMLRREFDGDLGRMLDREQPEYIVLDFIEERHDLLEYQGQIYTKSDALMESDFPVQEGRAIGRDSEECCAIWESACLTLIGELKKRFQPSHVILVENVLAEKHGNIQACKEFENIEIIKRINQILRSYYSFFKKHFHGIQCLDMTTNDLYITDDQFEYGCYPWHLNEWMNRKIGEAMFF